MNANIAEERTEDIIDGNKITYNSSSPTSIYIKLDRSGRDIRIVSDSKPFKYIRVNDALVQIEHLNEVVVSLELYMKRNLFKTNMLLTSDNEMILHYKNMGYEVEGYLDSIACTLLKSNI